MCNLPDSSAPGFPQGSQRDPRLDLWRGLCIADMGLVHLIDKGLFVGSMVSTILLDYTRFAAGGFVLISGLCIGAIHLNKARDPARRRTVYLGLLRRAWLILGVHYAAELAYMLACPIAGERVDVVRTVLDVLLLWQGYDLLPFYVCMLVVCPILLELVRCGFWWVAAGLSAGMFAWGSHDPWTLSVPLQQHFFPMLWQLIFVVGVLLGTQLHRYDCQSVRVKLAFTSAWWMLAAGLTSLARTEVLGRLPEWGVSFMKVPLSLPEAGRYMSLTLAIVGTTDLLWRRIEPLRITAAVCCMGRSSLALAATHIWIVGWTIQLSWALGPSALATAGYFAIALLSMWLVACTLDGACNAWKGWRPQWPRLEQLAPPAAIAGVILALVLFNPVINTIAEEAVQLADGPDLTESREDDSNLNLDDDMILPDEPSFDPAASASMIRAA